MSSLALKMTNNDFLLQHFFKQYVECGKDALTGLPVTIRLGDFLRYQAVQQDRSPLYVFDSRMPLFGTEYTPLDVFSEGSDYFATMPGRRRPPYRWELLGPVRSGSSLHVDPLQTSAWNTLLTGTKLWVLLSPNTTTIFPTSSSSPAMSSRAVDFFEHELPNMLRRLQRTPNTYYYFLQHPGETVFVPFGWHHAVLNLEDTIAITQNWVGNHNLAPAWRSLRVERKKLAKAWKSSLRKTNAALFARLDGLDLEDGYDLDCELAKEMEWRLNFKHNRYREEE